MIALLLKEIWQHATRLFAASVLLSAMVVIAIAVVLQNRQPTLVTAVFSVLYYAGPMYIIYVCERLVSTDYAEGTAEFLSALPIPPFVRLTVAWLLGAVVVVGVYELNLLLTLFLAFFREGIPFMWVVQLHIQLLLFALAWYAVGFAIQLTGRFRWLTWWLVLLLGPMLEDIWRIPFYRKINWTALLADSVEHARSFPPWDAVPITLFWITVGLGCALMLAVWRGGSLASGAFTPSSARQRAMLVMVGVFAPLVQPLLEPLGPVPDTWAPLPQIPARHAVIRSADPKLEPLAVEASKLLDQIGDAALVNTFMPIVLLPARRGLHRHVRQAEGGADVSLVLLVDPSGPEAMIVREIVTQALWYQTDDLGVLVPEIQEVLAGAAGVFAPSDTFALRASLVPDPSLPYPELLRTVGPDLAEAVAAARLSSLTVEERSRALQLALRSSTASVFGLSKLRRAAHAIPKGEALFTDEPSTYPPVLPAIQGDSLEFPAPQGTVLQILELDPLESLPRPFQLGRARSVGGEATISWQVDPSQNVVGRLLLYWPPIEGWLTTAWVTP